ncbi:MAG: hypothetical protein ACR2M9_01145 [Cyanophyceae cyanobacterium]
MGLGIGLGVGWCGCGGASGVGCNQVTVAGGPGITDDTIALDPAGGVITMMFEPQGVPDKLEIYHGNPTTGTKVATSGMTVANAGPFDNVYGTVSTGDVVPTLSQTLSVDQFIGTSKGGVPTRAGAYTTETGIANPLVPPYQQLVWWVYTATDYQNGVFVTIRVTGSTGTLWSHQRFCNTP